MANDTFYYIYLSLIVIGILILYMKYQEQVSKNSIPMSRLQDDLEMIGEYYYKNTAENLEKEKTCLEKMLMAKAEEEEAETELLIESVN